MAIAIVGSFGGGGLQNTGGDYTIDCGTPPNNDVLILFACSSDANALACPAGWTQFIDFEGATTSGAHIHSDGNSTAFRALGAWKHCDGSPVSVTVSHVGSFSAVVHELSGCRSVPIGRAIVIPQYHVALDNLGMNPNIGGNYYEYDGFNVQYNNSALMLVGFSNFGQGFLPGSDDPDFGPAMPPGLDGGVAWPIDGLLTGSVVLDDSAWTGAAVSTLRNAGATGTFNYTDASGNTPSPHLVAIFDLVDAGAPLPVTEIYPQLERRGRGINRGSSLGVG